MAAPEHRYTPHKKAIPVVVAVLVTASVSGYFMGLRQIAHHSAAQRELHLIERTPAPSKAAQVPLAVSYEQMRVASAGRDRNLESTLEDLVEPDLPPPPLFPASPEERKQAINRRAETRAFEGAPPVVSHPIDSVSTRSCLSCHATGRVVKDRVSTPISHPHWANCTQCHVPSDGLGRFTQEEWAAAMPHNHFVGSRDFAALERAFEGAPPVVPHPVWMRNNCLSCHGPKGEPALRTTHPERQNCLQCHAPSLDRDHAPFLQHDLMQFLNGTLEERP
jgi:nitrate reductase (cytochrome), electron transfer subunit